MTLPRCRLFVLGAGFSKPAGLPLGVELLDEVRHRVRNEFRAHGWDGPLEREIAEWRELYPGRELHLESVLAYSHRKHFLGLIGSKEYFDHGSRSIVSARRAIQSVLTEAIPHAAPDLYRAFGAHLTPHDSVLTFNYDTLLEQTLDELGKPYTLTPEWWLDSESSISNQEGKQFVDLLKLHGSIDWYDKHYYKEARAYYSALPHEVPDRDPLFGPEPVAPIECLARGPVSGGRRSELLERVVRVPNHRSFFPLGPYWDLESWVGINDGVWPPVDEERFVKAAEAYIAKQASVIRQTTTVDVPVELEPAFAELFPVPRSAGSKPSGTAASQVTGRGHGDQTLPE